MRERPKSSKIYGDGTAGIKIAEVLSKVGLCYKKSLTYDI